MGRDRRRVTGTVRFRVTALATLAVAAVLAVASLLLVARQRHGLTDLLDETLSARAVELADAAGADVAGADGPPQPFTDDDAVAQIVTADGRVRAASPALAGRGPIAPVPDDDGTALAVVHDLGEDGDPYRVASHAFVDASGRRGAVHVAAPLDDIDESVAELASSLALIVPLATLALAAVVWAVVGRTLRPVERIRAEVAGIGLGELDRRVPEPPTGDEVARLAATMNEMLGRLERSARRQERFVADASHELRTPITRMRAELEADGRDPAHADAAATRASLLDELTALHRLIDDLLLLARTDAGAPAGRTEVVDLDDVVLEEVRARAGGSVVIDARRVSAAQVSGHREHLRRVVRNLLDNAVRHATSTVTVELAEDDGWARLAVADDGPGIAPEHQAAVFERFTRLDGSRSGGAGRAGLGLAIARDLVVRHGGTIGVDVAHAGGARLVVELPATPLGQKIGDGRRRSSDQGPGVGRRGRAE